MTPRAFLLALAVVAVWGTNFVVIKLALADLPPLLFAALRFTAVVCPAALFFKRPDVPVRDLAAYGLLIGVGQFGLLFIAVDGLIAPGLASLLMQVQVFFTIALVMRSTGERLLRIQWLALALACLGLGIIVAHTGGTTTLAGVGLCLLAALSWAFGNIVQRRAGRIDMVAFVVWSSLFAVPPLIVLALVFEGPSTVVAATLAAGWGAWLAVLWQAVGNAMFGFGAWGWLLALPDVERRADGVARAGLRHGGVGVVPRRAAAALEAWRGRADPRRAGGQPARTAPAAPRVTGRMIRLIRPCLILSALLGFAAPVALLIYDIAVGIGSDGWAIGGLIALSLGLALLFAGLAGVFALLAVRRRGE